MLPIDQHLKIPIFLLSHELGNIEKSTLEEQLNTPVFNLSVNWEKNVSTSTAWKVSKYGVISGLYFPVFRLNTGIYGPEIIPYLDSLYGVSLTPTLKNLNFQSINKLGNQWGFI